MCAALWECVEGNQATKIHPSGYSPRKEKEKEKIIIIIIIIKTKKIKENKGDQDSPALAKWHGSRGGGWQDVVERYASAWPVGVSYRPMDIHGFGVQPRSFGWLAA